MRAGRADPARYEEPPVDGGELFLFAAALQREAIKEKRDEERRLTRMPTTLCSCGAPKELALLQTSASRPARTSQPQEQRTMITSHFKVS